MLVTLNLVVLISRRCDLQRPLCYNCTSSGRDCEGYERFPIFITKTAEGYQKRRPLEEVKPREFSLDRQNLKSRSGFNGVSKVKSTSVSPTSRQLSPAQSPITTDAAFSMGTRVAHADGNISAGTFGCSLKVYEMQWTQLFLDMSVPTDAIAKSQSQGLTGPFEIDRQTSSTVSHTALQALVCTRVGRVKDDTRLIACGTAYYGKALRLVQNACSSLVVHLHFADRLISGVGEQAYNVQ